MPRDPIRITVWSDYVCPFCYLERPILDRVRQEMGSDVAVDWRAFELRPEPEPTLDPDGEYLHRVWNQSVYPMAKERGLTLNLPPIQPRSRKAHEAAEFARHEDRLDAMNLALFEAFFRDGRDLAAIAVLLDIGQSVGLDTDSLRDALGSGRYAERVLEDQRLAQQIGISGVPALVVSTDRQAYLISGAQSHETVRGVVDRAMADRNAVH